MGCSACSKKRQEKAAAKAAEKESSAKLLEHRLIVCLGCDQNRAGECALLHGRSLVEYAAIAPSLCPHPEPKW